MLRQLATLSSLYVITGSAQQEFLAQTDDMQVLLGGGGGMLGGGGATLGGGGHGIRGGGGDGEEDPPATPEEDPPATPEEEPSDPPASEDPSTGGGEESKMIDTDDPEFQQKVYDSIEERCDWQNQMCRGVLDESLGSKKKKWLWRAQEAGKDSTYRQNFAALLDLVKQALTEQAMEKIEKDNQALVAPMQKKAIAFIVGKLAPFEGKIDASLEQEWVDDAKYPYDRESYKVFRKHVDLADLQFDKTAERVLKEAN